MFSVLVCLSNTDPLPFSPSLPHTPNPKPFPHPCSVQTHSSKPPLQLAGLDILVEKLGRRKIGDSIFQE